MVNGDSHANSSTRDLAATSISAGRRCETQGRVVIGRGRDASGVAVATTFGGPVLESMVVIAEEA
jgi:hypothetical protein